MLPLPRSIILNKDERNAAKILARKKELCRVTNFEFSYFSKNFYFLTKRKERKLGRGRERERGGAGKRGRRQRNKRKGRLKPEWKHISSLFLSLSFPLYETKNLLFLSLFVKFRSTKYLNLDISKQNSRVFPSAVFMNS